MRFCTSCGSPLEKDARFCIMCGAKVIPPVVPKPKESVEPKEPEKPVTPEEPEEPVAPEEPEAPETPEEPAEPERTEEPEVPEAPEVPEEPEEPDEHEEPEEPEEPGEPEKPEEPEAPETPEESAEPEVPEAPEEPEAPEIPAEPEPVPPPVPKPQSVPPLLPQKQLPPQKPLPPQEPVQPPPQQPVYDNPYAPPAYGSQYAPQPQQPAWDDRYAPPQRPAYDSRYAPPPPAYGNRCAPPQRPAYDNRYAPPRQAYPAYGRPNPGRGRNGTPPGKPPLKNKGLLKFLSFLFALGLLVVSAGLAGTIWFNRYAAASLDTYAERENITERVSARRKRLFNEALVASINSEITDGLKAQVKFKDASTDTAYIDKLNAAELEAYRENNRLRLEKAEKQFGFSWTVLKFAQNANLFLIAGGILCGFSLILWFALGGRFSRFSRTTVAPLLTMFMIWGICIVLLASLLPAPNLADLSVPDRLESKPAETVSPSPYDFPEFNGP